MKFLIFLSTLLFLLPNDIVKASSNGLYSFEGPLNEAMAKAKSESKFLLIKFGAKWSTSCQQMDHTIFNGLNAEKLFGENWIVKSIDFDSEEGKSWRAYYHIKVLPTVLLIDPSKPEVLARKEQAMDLNEFIEWFENYGVQRKPTLQTDFESAQIPIEKQSHPDADKVYAPPQVSSESGIQMTLSAEEDMEHRQLEIPKENEEELFFQKFRAKENNQESAEHHLSREEIESLQNRHSNPSMILVGDYFLRTKKYDDLEAAMKEVDRLDKLFNQAANLSEMTDQNGDLFFYVILGSFVTEEEAGLFQQYLKKYNIQSEVAKLKME
ncbi:MAG: thioredoxin family protein [Saprospiraceae bacterium]|nr:thioredoxin family protein [Saprospiraceae bacterium]